MMSSYKAILLSFALAGCAATGVKVSEEQAHSFQVGRSSYGDVVAGLGQPTSTTVTSGGTRVATYSYSAIQSRPQNFIPYIGPLVAGYDQSSSAVTFTFDQRGLLQSTSSSQSNLGTGAGLAAGSVQPAPATAQPR
jgi:outer membrane protein assembly factor BamE (lipoprotein component of BamABCDE complex)